MSLLYTRLQLENVRYIVLRARHTIVAVVWIPQVGVPFEAIDNAGMLDCLNPTCDKDAMAIDAWRGARDVVFGLETCCGGEEESSRRRPWPRRRPRSCFAAKAFSPCRSRPRCERTASSPCTTPCMLGQCELAAVALLARFTALIKWWGACCCAPQRKPYTGV
eukprot:TRINITY_DN9937_c0_g1_i9.p1 TRINITY_DN9937_c0_g1~~TRINITY_DN9937_c0_g1_i9.p1  ORF type:complete len:163 (+),score=2.72 TRINITY_DN9937_c0_g1_i9:107-595(+)